MEELLWGLALIDWNRDGIREVRKRWRNHLSWQPISRTWALLKIFYSPEGVRKSAIKSEPRIPYLLLAGRIGEACEIAVKRLRIDEFDPFDVNYEEQLDPTRLLASLMIPIIDQHMLETMVLRPVEKPREGAKNV
jgi:CRISPR-associated protein Csx17